MLFGKGGGSPKGGSIFSQDKQNPIVLVAVIVVIAVAGFFVYRSMTADSAPPPEQVAPPSMPGPAGPVPPGATGPAPAPGPAPSPDTATAPPAGPQGAPAATPAQAPTAPPAAAPAPKPTPTAQASKATAEKMAEMKVFGSVVISYPASWKIAAGAGNMSAVFTNGKALFEVHPPDPKATTAKAIAEAGAKKLALGSAITAQGADKVSGHDAYWISVKTGGGLARIVGVDAPTRVLLYEHAAGGAFATYKPTFDKMQSGIKFGG